MNRELIDALQLDAHDALTTRELAELSGLAEAILQELVEDGALRPIDRAAPTWRFTGECIVLARTASRLSRDLELDTHALAVVMRLMNRVQALECELRALRA